MGINASPSTALNRAVSTRVVAKKISAISHYGMSGGHFVFGNAAVKPGLPLQSRPETRIRIQRAFRGLFGASLDLLG
jgi:hypothetical protein